MKTHDARLPLIVRVGITGHRAFPDGDEAEISRKIEFAFARVREAASTLKSNKVANSIFTGAEPQLTLLSPLAEGADRVAATVAIKANVPLASVLPFTAAEYLKDFPASEAQFQFLLDKASKQGGVATLDGIPQPKNQRDLAYRNVGRFVVRHVDILIAVWNGKIASGLGGTAEIIDFAENHCVPVIVISSVWPHELSLHLPGRKPEPFTETALAVGVSRLMLPPMPVPAHSIRWWQFWRRRRRSGEARLARFFSGERGTFDQTEPDFLFKGPFKPHSWLLPSLIAPIFPSLLRLLATKSRQKAPRAVEPPAGRSDPATRSLFLQFQRADALATRYSDIHRSAFILVYMLGALALTTALIGAIWHHNPYPPFAELICLSLILLLVVADHIYDWRGRWLEYRVLAELLREADLLAQVGQPLSADATHDIADELPEAAWVSIASNAIVRSAGISRVELTEGYLERVRDYAAKIRLQDQIAYHMRTRRRNDSAGNTLIGCGESLFWMTVAAVIIELGSVIAGLERSSLITLLTGLLPALAYAAFGIRNQAEFELVGRRSDRMRVRLKSAKKRISNLTGRKLTSENLSHEITLAATIMHRDAADWAGIFQVKETGVS